MTGESFVGGVIDAYDTCPDRSYGTRLVTKMYTVSTRGKVKDETKCQYTGVNTSGVYFSFQDKVYPGVTASGLLEFFSDCI